MQFINWKSAQQWLVLAVIVLASSWPLLSSQMFFTHDFVHGVRIAEMTRALHDGHFPVRWSSNFAYGYGMPLFEFYAPLPFYIGTLLYVLGFSLILSSKFLFLLPNIFTALGSYLLGRKLSTPWGGLLAAALITLAPYRGMNLFIRGAVSETWGILALVWILYSTVLVLEKKKYGGIVLVLSLVTLFLSHNLSVVIAAPFIAIWTVVLLYLYSVKENTNFKQFTWLKLGKYLTVFAGYYLLAIGLASFYLLPIYTEKDFTKVETATTGGYFDYKLHFLYIRQLFRTEWGYGGSEWGPDDKLPFFLGYGQYFGLAVSGAGLAVGAWWYGLKRKTLDNRNLWLLLISLIAVGVSLFMTLGKSQFIWDAVEFLKYIQFPWRYYAVMVVFLGLAATLSLQFLPKKVSSYLAVSIILITVSINWQYFRPEKYLEDAAVLYYDNPRRVQTHMSEILPDYIPKQMSSALAAPDRLVSCGEVACEQLNVTSDLTHKKVFLLESSTTQSIQVSIANYPGWQATIDGIPTEVQTAKNGLLEITVPPGKHAISVFFGGTVIRQLADTVSGISSIIFVGWILILRIKNDRN